MKPRASGFSLIEVLISSLLLMVIALGVLPVFIHGASSNEAGREFTMVSNFAKSRAEEYSQSAFNSAALTVTAGTQLVVDEYYSFAQKTWLPGTSAAATAAGDTALWTRTTTVRQFNIADLTNPLPAGSPPETVHLKEITVDVQGITRTGLSGAAKRATVRVLRSQ
jgi:Tfp pilus assembly protein PilV